MDEIRISVVTGAALLALAGTASAGPMTVQSAQVISPPTQIEQARYYYRHHYRNYGWHHGWHYGWYHHRYRHYGWYHHRYYPRYYGYYNPGAAIVGGAVGLATLPFALATGWPYY